MVENLGQTKIAMAKTPITIQEDQDALENDAEAEISKMLAELEIFFQPLTNPLDEFINPQPSEEEQAAAA